MKDIDNKLTADEQNQLDALDARPITYDSDCPELTIDQIKQFKNMDETRNQTVSIVLSPQTMSKAKALGNCYTSVLSKILDIALNDDELVKRCCK
jgi:hypothetical protein